MNHTLPAALGVCLTLALAVSAAETKPRKSTRKHSTLPTKSKMIDIGSSTNPAVLDGPEKLISSEMSGRDLQFFTTAVAAGRLQAHLVGLLQNKAESEQIKALGAALSSTQGEENKQIALLASRQGWAVSPELTPAQKKLGADLEKQTGSQFDKAVMDELVASSQQSVSAYQTAAQSGDRDIRSFAEQMLPIAQEKLRLTEKMTGAGQAAAHLFRTSAPPKAILPPAQPEPIPPPIVK